MIHPSDIDFSNPLVSIVGSGVVTLIIFITRWYFSQREKKRQEKVDQDKLLAKQKLEQVENDKKEEAARVVRQQEIDDSNTKMALVLREEMRKDRERAIAEVSELRQLLQASENRNTRTEARVDELGKINDGLRGENMNLSAENGAQRKQLELQAVQIKDLENKNQSQSAKIGELTVQNVSQAERITTLEEIVHTLVAAMESSNIVIPEIVRVHTESIGVIKNKGVGSTIESPAKT